MRIIKQSTALQIARPNVEVVQYADSELCTYVVEFPNATYTRKAEYDKKEARQRAKSFADAFNDIATDIENGGRKRFIMNELGLTRDEETSLWHSDVRKRQDERVTEI